MQKYATLVSVRAKLPSVEMCGHLSVPCAPLEGRQPDPSPLPAAKERDEMGIGVSLVLIAIGAVITFAIHVRRTPRGAVRRS
jgi:hypothetical protein